MCSAFFEPSHVAKHSELFFRNIASLTPSHGKGDKYELKPVAGTKLLSARERVHVRSTVCGVVSPRGRDFFLSKHQIEADKASGRTLW